MRAFILIATLLFVHPAAVVGQGTLPSGQAGSLTAQNRWRMVQTERWSKDDPVFITSIDAGGNAVSPGIPFSAADNWFDDLRVTVTNRSTHTIVAGRLRLGFPEAMVQLGNQQNSTVGIQILAGSPPLAARTDVAGRVMEVPLSKRISIAPGQSYTFALKDDLESLRQKFARTHAQSSLTRCVLALQTFYFSDGSSWTPGQQMRNDLN